MTSTTTFGGFNPEGRNSSKVLKPPGGGSSDIFGTSGEGQPAENGGRTPTRAVRNHNASNLYLSDGGRPGKAPPTPAARGNDTHSRLFGPAPATPTPAPARRTDLLLQDLANSNEVAVTNGENGHTEPDSGSVQSNGNPSPPPLMNGNSTPAAPRNRVPPGGYSSGLW